MSSRPRNILASSSLGASLWGQLQGTVANQTDLVTYLGENYFKLGSANALTGNVTTSGAFSFNTIISSGGTSSIINNKGGVGGITIGGSTSTLLLTDSRTIKKGFEYNADYSAGFTDRSLIDKGYADISYIKTGGNSIIPSIGNGGMSITIPDDDPNIAAGLTFNLNVTGDSPTGGDISIIATDPANVGSVVFSLTSNQVSFGAYNGGWMASIKYVLEGTAIGGAYLKILELPAANPCGSIGAGSGTIWDDAGTLKRCP